MVCPERGTLSSLIHNETVEMDNEMIVTIMKDVAMGIKFLHFSKIPTQDEELTPTRVLLDSNYRAQLMHFQLQAVRTPCWFPKASQGVLEGDTGLGRYSQQTHHWVGCFFKQENAVCLAYITVRLGQNTQLYFWETS